MPNKLIKDIIDKGAVTLKEQGYSIRSSEYTLLTWKQFQEFCNKKGYETYLPSHKDEFITELGKCTPPLRQSTIDRKAGSMKMLDLLATKGTWGKGMLNPLQELLPEFNSFLDAQEEYLIKTGYSECTRETMRNYISVVMRYFQNAGITKLEELNSSHVSAYLLTLRGHAKSTVRCELSRLRKFLSYLYLLGYTSENLAPHVPEYRLGQAQSIIKIWESEEINAVLETVNRASPKGKRDYAFITIAAELGVRSKDICNLKLSDIDWELCSINTPVLPELVVEKWIEKRPNEKRKNQKWRLNFTKRFAKYLQLNGYAAYYPELTISSRDDADFSPCIFTSDELARIMKYFETMVPSRQCPTAHLVFPLLFKTLICCGLRAGEATLLRVKDVDLINGVLQIWETKHDKPRYVPLSKSLWADYEQYFEEIHAESSGNNYFFPNPRKSCYHTTTVYNRFRDALWHCGIAHKGRGYGPRVHDLRHTFAVRSMQKLKKSKSDIVTTLPYLSAYLGHCNMSATQIYLHLTAECYPEFIQKQCDYLGDTIPTWEAPNENC